MKKVALVVLSLLTVGLAACGKPSVSTPSGSTTNPATVTTSATEATTVPQNTGVEEQIKDQNWISPAKVEIGGYYAGAQAEFAVRIHLGAHTSQRGWKVTTDPGETKVVFQLTDALYQGKVANVVLLTSDLSGEKLTATAYSEASKELTIEGFQPAATRTLTLQYYSPSAISVYYKLPDHALEGYVSAPDAAKDWVTVAETSPVLQPWETREVLITLAMPKGAMVEAKKWEFWIAMSVASGGMIQTEMAVRWLVTMK